MRNASAGSILLEGVISLFVLAIALVSVLSVLAAARRLDSSELVPQEDAARAVEDARRILRNYVTADPGAATADFAPRSPAGGRPAEGWRLPGDPCAWALQPGCTHKATALLPESFAVRYATACLTYTVTETAPEEPLKVDFTVGWKDDRPECIQNAAR